MSAETTPRQRQLAYFSWLAVCLIWGTTYLGIRVSLETMPPALMGGLRWLIAGGLLSGYLMARGTPLPPPSRWGSIALLGFLLLGLGNGGVVVAEQWVSSGLAAVLVATCPFWMSAIEACLPDGERLGWTTIAGLLVGFGGIILLVWPELTTAFPREGGLLAGIIAAQIACFGWALGSAFSRRQKRDENVFATTALQMLAGGIIMTLAGTIRGEWASLHFTDRTAWALAYLSTIGAIGGMVAYTYALRHLPMSFVSLYAYINPIIAVALGVMLLNEPFDSRMAAAAALVFAGVTIVRWRGSPERRHGSPKSLRYGRPRALGALLFVLATASVAGAQEAAQPNPSPSPAASGRTRSFVTFLAGGAVGLLEHEGGHLLCNAAFDADPGFRRVEFHGIPFFAITHRPGLSPRREFVIASAGFWAQHAGSEWILTARPFLRDERRPFLKGVLAFNVIASTAYAGVAFARTGPGERDTRGMAATAAIDERWIGAMVLAPAVLDAWRYLRPDGKWTSWAKWASRASKIGVVILVARAGSEF